MKTIPVAIEGRRKECRACPFAERKGGQVTLDSWCRAGGHSVGRMIEATESACPKGRFPPAPLPQGHFVIEDGAIAGWKDGPRHVCC